MAHDGGGALLPGAYSERTPDGEYGEWEGGDAGELNRLGGDHKVAVEGEPRHEKYGIG
jgi:hypothetical protein